MIGANPLERPRDYYRMCDDELLVERVSNMLHPTELEVALAERIDELVAELEGLVSLRDDIDDLEQEVADQGARVEKLVAALAKAGIADPTASK